MAMLKLTLVDYDETLHLKAASIESLRRNWRAVTVINTDSGDQHSVKETPEEIMAMPEMRNEIDKSHLAAYPPMNLGSNQFPIFEVP